ncbi:hypothetical protein AMECASPLE_031678 [Ameca splendens]|uniref:Uncharacterized protein n=1 Tax=Ameca splendens TaxID=208324 RepID=A0ABV1A4C2_9TELE
MYQSSSYFTLCGELRYKFSQLFCSQAALPDEETCNFQDFLKSFLCPCCSHMHVTVLCVGDEHSLLKISSQSSEGEELGFIAKDEGGRHRKNLVEIAIYASYI